MYRSCSDARSHPHSTEFSNSAPRAASTAPLALSLISSSTASVYVMRWNGVDATCVRVRARVQGARVPRSVPRTNAIKRERFLRHTPYVRRAKGIRDCAMDRRAEEEAFWGIIPRELFHVSFGSRLCRASGSPFSAPRTFPPSLVVALGKTLGGRLEWTTHTMPERRRCRAPQFFLVVDYLPG